MTDDAKPHDPEEASAGRNARYGLVLFFVYLLFYGGFMAWNVYDFKSMSQPVGLFGGVNFAIVYGFGLIVLALVLAAVYMLLCRTPVKAGEGRS